MSFPQTYYKEQETTCRSCGGPAKELHQNSPFCRYCLKEIESLEMERKIELKSQEQNSELEQLITRKRTGKLFLDDIVRKVKLGELSPEFATLQLKQLSKEFTNTLKELEELTHESLVGTDYYIYGDYKITRREGSVSYDFSECEEVVAMERHLKELKAKYVAAHKGVTQGVTVALEDHCFADSDGTILKLPKKKFNKSSIVLTKV